MSETTAVIPDQRFGISEEIVEQVSKRIGPVPARTPHFSEVARPSVHMWAKAIGSRNLLAFDESYARQSCYGTIVAPGTFLYAVDDTVHIPDVPTLGSCYADVSWEFFRPLRLGTKLSASSTIDEVVVKSSAFAGLAIHQRSTTEYTDGYGRLVARARPSLVSYNREAAVAIGRYADIARYQFPLAELESVSDAYDDEQIRGAEVRYAEEVRVGDPLGPVVRGPLTAEDVICFIERSCPPATYEYFLDARHNGTGYWFTDEYGVPDSWFSALLLDDVAAREGVPVAHDYGPERVCWVADAIQNWAGDAGFLRRLHVRLTAPSVHTHATWMRGEVTALDDVDGAQVASVRLTGVNQSGMHTIQADAEVELQSLRVPVRAQSIR
jgi:acyl dehydratase